MNSVVGVDEVGRGPLAGPLCVCALKLTPKSQFYSNATVRDSKKLTEKERMRLFCILQEEAKWGSVAYALSYVSPRRIDSFGMSKALCTATKNALEKLKLGETDTILLDGSLKAPSTYLNQTTLIKGDESERSIALASIVAKVSRDKRMGVYAKKWPEYKFENNKGYGTLYHYDAIRRHGLCAIHRRSFLKKVLIFNENNKDT
ncbi:MAG: ribonuclease HII [Candidatus Paceibacterota bacterium]